MRKKRRSGGWPARPTKPPGRKARAIEVSVSSPFLRLYFMESRVPFFPPKKSITGTLYSDWSKWIKNLSGSATSQKPFWQVELYHSYSLVTRQSSSSIFIRGLRGTAAPQANKKCPFVKTGTLSTRVLTFRVLPVSKGRATSPHFQSSAG